LKTQELKNYSFICASDLGFVREENEDAYAHFESVNGSFFILCDGMGGLSHGKEAAEQTISELENELSTEWEDNPIVLINNAIKSANKKVFEYFKTEKNGEAGGTTIALVLIRDNKMYYAHIGDSRIYYQTGKKLFQLTEDHSVIKDLIKKKLVSEEDAKKDIRRHQITKAVGINETVEPTICKKPINPADNDFVLLCSDGLSNELKHKEILNILLNSKSIKEKKDALIKKALKKGGDDNITLQLIRFYNTGRDKNTEFLSNLKNKKRLKTRAFFLLILIAIMLLTFVFISEKKENYKNKKQTNFVSETNLLIAVSKKQNLDFNLYLKSNDSRNKILNYKYFDTIYKISKLQTDDENVNYQFFDNNIFLCRPGKQIETYPGINQNIIIDNIIIQNKKELYFKPGEKLIIPKKRHE
jgi:serine/threonine protein phosphatase PrpC